MDLDLSNEYLKMEDLLNKEDIEILKKYGINQHFFDCLNPGNILNADFGDLPHIVKKAKISGIINQAMSIDFIEKFEIVRFSDDSLASGILLIEIGRNITLSDVRKVLEKIQKQMDIEADLIYVLNELSSDNEIMITGFFF